MGLDLPAGTPLDLLERETNLLDLRDAPAGGADDVMVVTGWLAGHVGVLSREQVEALENVELREEVQGAEDRGTADAQPAGPGVSHEVRRGEVTFAGYDELRHGATGPGKPVSGAVECRQERLDAGRTMDRRPAID
jgi:hypothetical protein